MADVKNPAPRGDTRAGSGEHGRGAKCKPDSTMGGWAGEAGQPASLSRSTAKPVAPRVALVGAGGLVLTLAASVAEARAFGRAGRVLEVR